jgi:histidinol phosphatase-like PHP family hydrolase
MKNAEIAPLFELILPTIREDNPFCIRANRRASRSIDTDTHRPTDLGHIELGVATARRGGIEADRVVNAWPVEKLVDWTRERRSAQDFRRSR